MIFGSIFKLSWIVFLLLILPNPATGQDSVKTTHTRGSNPAKLLIRLSDQDIILPITNIEWGIPDRWSFTSRYIHKFEKERTNKLTWRNNIGISMSPGITGIRFSIGYLGLYSPVSMREFGIFSEIRFLVMRTWGNPLTASANHTYAGIEIRCSMVLINLGLGYYRQISGLSAERKDFFGYHIGVGI